MIAEAWRYHCDDGSHPVHVWPEADLVDHETETGEPDCVCGPTVEPVEREDGSFGWLYSHHRLVA